jgi:hypothetical protein
MYSGTTLMQHTTPSPDVAKLLRLPETGGCVTTQRGRLGSSRGFRGS